LEYYRSTESASTGTSTSTTGVKTFKKQEKHYSPTLGMIGLAWVYNLFWKKVTEKEKEED